MAEKILIVEDDERFRRALRSALADQGYGIEEAGSVSDAREVLKREAIQVILLDLNLPVQSGTVLLELIKNRADEYRVIILTAHDDRLSAEKAKSYSVYRYLTKTSHSFSESLRFEINSAFEDLEKSKKRIFLSYARENHSSSSSINDKEVRRRSRGTGRGDKIEFARARRRRSLLKQTQSPFPQRARQTMETLNSPAH